MKKFIALFLAISFLLMNCATYKRGAGVGLEPNQKPGALLIIQQKDGDLVGGELIAVKQNSLLLKEARSGGDVTIDIKDIRVIKIVRKSKAGWGSLIGAGIGVLAAVIHEETSDGWGFAYYFYPPLFAVFGTLQGAVAGIDEKIPIEGKSDSEIKEALEKLRKKARVTNFQ